MNHRNDPHEPRPLTTLRFDQIVFETAGLRIIDGVSLSVGNGEILCLLGPSGCGKTTLLRIAAGLERPTSGAVYLGDQLVAAPQTFTEPDKRGIGLMFQDYALFPHLTVIGNVMFGLADLPSGQARDLAERELARVGLAGHAEDYPHMLSGGEQQRVALARAMVPNPRVLLMDEPFSNLDQRMRERIRDETMVLVRAQKTTAIMVTHDPVEAMAVADRIALLRSGRLEQVGTPAEIYFQPRTLYAARFLCDVNEIEGHCRGGTVECRLGNFAAPGVPDGPAVVCVRPQSIEIAREGEGLSGTIRDARCLGETTRLTVEVDGLERALCLSLPAAKHGPSESCEVRLRIDAASILVFPALDDAGDTFMHSGQAGTCSQAGV